MKIAIDNVVGKIGGKFTFAGVLVEYYDEIFARCNENTRSEYNSTYNTYILPHFLDRPIEEFTAEDCEAAISENCSRKAFSESTLVRHRYLIRTVFDKAVEKNLCSDVMFGTAFSLLTKSSLSEEREKLAKQGRVQKSLETSEEIALFERIMVDPTQDGSKMGLALMFALGLRNGEACAMRFSAIREMENCPGRYCAWVTSSTEGRTNKVKAGGKTRNAPRKIPVCAKLLTLLQKRKEYLQQQVDEGNLVIKEGKSIEDLPIVCRKDYVTSLTAEQLSAEGRAVLKEIKFSGAQLANIELELREDAKFEMHMIEKDPTAYLLRRNFGTKLHALMLNHYEIQYIMGHEMEDEDAYRRDYSDDEILLKIARKMDRHPVLGDKTYEETQHLSGKKRMLALQDVSSVVIEVEDAPAGMLSLYLTSMEPYDDVSVSVIYDDGTEQKVSEFYTETEEYEASDMVNVLKAYHDECDRFKKLRRPKI